MQTTKLALGLRPRIWMRRALLCAAAVSSNALVARQVSRRAGTAKMSTMTFEPPSRTAGAALTILVGRKDALLSAGARGLLPEGLPEEIWAPLVEKIKPGDAGGSASTMFASPTGARTVMAAVLPEHCSRTTRRSGRTRSRISSVRPPTPGPRARPSWRYWTRRRTRRPLAVRSHELSRSSRRSRRAESRRRSASATPRATDR